MEMTFIRPQGHPQINDENITIQNICEEIIELYKSIYELKPLIEKYKRNFKYLFIHLKS